MLMLMPVLLLCIINATVDLVMEVVVVEAHSLRLPSAAFCNNVHCLANQLISSAQNRVVTGSELRQRRHTHTHSETTTEALELLSC